MDSNFEDFIKNNLQITATEQVRQYIRVDLHSKDRTNKNEPSNICEFYLASPLTSKKNEIMNLTINSVQIPNSWNTIEQNFNDKIYITRGGGVEEVITIPEGNYSITQLKNKLVELLAGKNFTIGHDKPQNKFIYKNTQNWTIEFKNNSPSTVLGFEQKLYNFLAGVDYHSPFMMMNNRVNSVKIKTNLAFSNTISSSNVQEIGSTIANIPVTVPSFSMLNYSDNERKFGLLFQPGAKIDHIRLELVDQDNKAIDLNGLNWEVSFLIKYKTINYKM